MPSVSFRGGRLRPLVLTGFAVAVLAILSLGITAMFNLASVENDTDWVTHTYDVINALSDVLAGSVDVGAGARGFVNSGDPTQLDLHARGLVHSSVALKRVGELTKDNEGMHAELLSLSELIDERARLLDGLIELSRRSRDEARIDPRWNQTTVLTERLRSSLDRLQRAELGLLQARRLRLARRALGLAVVIVGGCTLLLAFVLATFVAALRHEEERERLVTYQGELMGVVGHDLRSPLSAIMMSMSLLSSDRELTTERRVNFSLRALASARRMERIIRDLLDFTRDRVGSGISIDVQPLDLGELCERVSAELALEYPSAVIRAEREGNLKGQWDADRMAQVVSNLVTNAVKYGEEGGEIRVRARELEDRITLEVHNHGTPIPLELQAHIFEPFQGGRATEASNARGRVGLGLHIVRTLVEAHGGAVAVTSANEETTFSVSLPRTE